MMFSRFAVLFAVVWFFYGTLTLSLREGWFIAWLFYSAAFAHLALAAVAKNRGD